MTAPADSARGKVRKLCPMCEAHGAGPCDECDSLNRVPRAKSRPLLPRLAKEHERCAEFYRKSKDDSHGINFVLVVMHSDLAAIYRKLVIRPRRQAKRKGK